jgi:response regulator of citrate/malate metabolism
MKAQSKRFWKTAALLGVGWYLMQPISTDRYWALSDWQRVQAFDTASQCQAGKQEDIDKTIQLSVKEMLAGVPRDEITREMSIAQSGRCVATDDPALRSQ